MRRRISAAALLVKVIAIISSGALTVVSKRKKRCVRSSVLPAPAGASTINDVTSKRLLHGFVHRCLNGRFRLRGTSLVDFRSAYACGGTSKKRSNCNWRSGRRNKGFTSQ